MCRCSVKSWLHEGREMPPRISQQKPPKPGTANGGEPEPQNSLTASMEITSVLTPTSRPSALRRPQLSGGIAPAVASLGLITGLDEGWDDGIKVLVYGKSGTGKTT